MALVNKDTAEKHITGLQKALLFRTKHYGTQQHSTSHDRANRYAYHRQNRTRKALYYNATQDNTKHNNTNSIDRLTGGNSHNAGINSLINVITRQDATEQNGTAQNTTKHQNAMQAIVTC